MALTKLVAKTPTAGTPKTWKFPDFTRTRLDSGFSIIVANAPGRTLATAQLLIEAGATNETSEEGGVASITANSLLEGTDVHKGASFIQTLERLGADISAGANWDSFGLNLTAPVSRLEPALELMAEAVRSPELPWRDVDRLTQQRAGGIMQEYASGASRATIAFNKLLYTPGSAYSRSSGGSFWSVSTMGKKSVKKYYEKYVTPASATLIVVGDLEGVPVEKIAEKLFGGWKGKEPERTEPLVAEYLKHTSALLVERPDSTQSQILMGHVGAPRSTPDYLPITAVGAVLGGLFDSRLNRKLREEKGYTYGISGGFNFRRKAGPFVVSTAVDTDVTVDAIAEIAKVVEKIHAEGITKQELELVKGFLTGVFSLTFETPQGIASALGDLVIFGLPDDYFQTYRGQVEKLTLDDCNRAAAEYLHPDRLGIVVVGDAKKVRDPLHNAGLGTVAYIEDPEPGNPPTH